VATSDGRDAPQRARSQGAPNSKANDPFAVRKFLMAKRRHGSQATDLQCPRDVRFSPKSDQIAALH